MRKQYETIVIFKADATDDCINKIGKRLEKAAGKKPGKFVNRKDWGTKRLCYEINKEKQGRYVSWVYEQESSAPKEMDKHLRFEEELLRYTTFAMDKKKRVQVELEVKNAKNEASGNEKYKKVPVDFRNPLSLSRYITEKGKIIPARVSGVSSQMQNLITREIKRARQIALLSYTSNFISDKAEKDRYEKRDSGSKDRYEKRDAGAAKGERKSSRKSS